MEQKDNWQLIGELELEIIQVFISHRKGIL